MTVLPPPSEPKLLLSFDFDGTLHEPARGLVLGAPFFEMVRKLREEQDALWVINTGRSLYQMVQGFAEVNFPFLPDHVIAREREIFSPGRFGRWLDLGKWNARCEKDHKKLFKKARKPLKKLEEFVTKETGARWIDQKSEPAGVVARTLEEMHTIAAKADEVCAETVNLGYERNSIYMRFSHADYHKGSALQEVQAHYGLTAEQTFVVGDGHNDLKMLRSEVARFIACPENAVEDVAVQVSALGGYQSTKPASEGVIDALDHFFVNPETQI